MWDNLEQYRKRRRHARAIPAPFGNIILRVGHLDEDAYIDALSDSDLCLAPRGTRVQSPQLIEMLWFGRIPVVIADNCKLPASCMFDWSRMAILVPEANVTNLGRILMDWRSNGRRLVRFRQRLLAVRQAFMWHTRDTAMDAFELAMVELFVKQQRGCPDN